ncbi:alpha-amylase [Enemella dayhoffiae]|uniref:Alpha-amylase n=1 Tax=Enemella dayhoffiae TaxID=2016507 RepID=A0A255GS83_9ACTN|nr:alpha-amylase family protein [Enemella dayhoffiae]OYO18707.1 alpha-amylase [Enemella dayhoffiae]
MQWPRTVIWWHVYPLGFTGAPIREGAARESGPQHRLEHLLGWLDHVVELGTNGLLLGPVFASDTHGYDTLDHFRIDPRLGDDADFDALAAGCRERGIRLVLDGVFNHVARGFGHEDWWRRSPEGHPWFFEGHDTLVEFDHHKPEVRAYTVEVMNHWLDRGADGWRLDAAYAVDPAFWAAVLPEVRERHPEAWFLGEVIHGDYPDLVRRSTLDSLTQYELWKATWSSLSDQNFFELDWTLRRNNELLDTFWPQTFVGNHDVTRIASRVGKDGAALAAAVLCTVPGIPSIYYGDEFGYTGEKFDRAGGDDQVRPVFPASPADISALGRDLFAWYQQLIGLRRRHPWLVDTPIEVRELENTRIRYAAGADGQEVVTELDVAAGTVRIGSSDGEELHWP